MVSITKKGRSCRDITLTAILLAFASTSSANHCLESYPWETKGTQVITKSIAVDVKQKDGPLSQTFRHCVGAGRANEGLRADWQQQLREAKQACGFEYIRMHGLLTDDMGVYREERGKPVYNWQYIDQLYDFLVDLKVRPFVEFGFMPGGLASGNKSIFWWRGNVTPPRDYEKWGNLITALVDHWKERYGIQEVKKWYFEVWNEPNLDGFWAGDQKQYFHLYTETANAVKRVSKDFRVGGPATAGTGWVPELINYCAETPTESMSDSSTSLVAVELFSARIPTQFLATSNASKPKSKSRSCQTCPCATPNGAHPTLPLIPFTTATSALRTFSKSSEIPSIMPIPCPTGPSPTSSRKPVHE